MMRTMLAVLMLSVTTLAQARFVSCDLAARVMEDYAANWRDKGYTLDEVINDIDRSVRRGNIGLAQADRLRYDAEGIYQNPILAYLPPREIREAFLLNCPREYTRP